MGGTPAVLKYLLKHGFIDGSCLTVTGAALQPDQHFLASLDISGVFLIHSCYSCMCIRFEFCLVRTRKNNGGESGERAGFERGAAGDHAPGAAHQGHRPPAGNLPDGRQIPLFRVLSSFSP